MKLSSMALVSVASASQELMFMQDLSQPNTELLSIGSGACINWSLSQNKFWSLKQFDAENRNEANKLPAVQIFDQYYFYYKACQTPWVMTQPALQAGNPNATLGTEWDNYGEATAFLVVDNKPAYSFLNAVIDTIALPATASDTAQENAQAREGWIITWSSI